MALAITAAKAAAALDSRIDAAPGIQVRVCVCVQIKVCTALNIRTLWLFGHTIIGQLNRDYMGKGVIFQVYKPLQQSVSA